MSKYLNSVSTKAVAVAALLALSSTAAMAEDDMISGSFGVSYNSNFVSYGLDVWGGGSSFFGSNSTTFVWGDVSMDLGDGLGINFGAWSDVNDNTAQSLGGNIQEVDVWLGASYAVDKWSFGATYQVWSYASDVEQIFDLSISYDDTGLIAPDFALNPSLLWHYRVDGNGGQLEGSALVFSVGPSVALDDQFSLSFPAGVAFFLDKDFQGGDGSFGYATVGVSLGAALPFIPSSYGEWSANFDVIGYFTDAAAIPGNVDENFLTTSIGLSISF